MKESITKAVICLDDELGLTYRLCEVDYIVREDESFTWKFRPNYSVISLLSTELFQGIPGLDLEQQKSEYVRENMTPVFISERSPSKNREDLWKLLEAENMDYYDPLEWLIRTKTRYSGDNLYVKSREENLQPLEISDLNLLGNRSSIISKELLSQICSGADIKLKDTEINDSNRKVVYTILLQMYSKEKSYIDEKRRKGIKNSSKNGNYKGRKRIKIDTLKLEEIMTSYEEGKISEAEGMKALKVSRSTFERRHREFLIRQ